MEEVMPNNNNEGFLMRNDRKKPGSKQPDHTGRLVVNNVELELAAWIRTAKHTGRKYFRVKAKPVEPARELSNDEDLDAVMPIYDDTNSDGADEIKSSPPARAPAENQVTADAQAAADSDSQAEPLITQKQHDRLRELGYSEDVLEGMTRLRAFTILRSADTTR
jgi:hypothetical protein